MTVNPVTYSTALRNAQLDRITAAIGASGLLKFYDGTRPASGGTATNLLATCTLNATFAPAANAGALTANAIAPDTNANGSGTTTWARITTSGGTYVMDMNVGLVGSGDPLEVDNTTITAGDTVAVSSLVITAGNL